MVSAKMTSIVFNQTKNGQKRPMRLVLNDTTHVPSLDSKLVSCSALNKQVYVVSFVNGKCNISRPGQQICTGELRDGFYFLRNVKIRDVPLLVSEKIDGESLWHNRFRHTNVALMRDMARKETVLGLDVKAKPEEGAFRLSSTLEKQPRWTLKRPHFEGPCFWRSVPHSCVRSTSGGSIGEDSYLVIFTGDTSSYNTVNFIEAKLVVLGSFLSVHSQFGWKNDCKVKLLYSDNGGEFVALQENVDRRGIEWHYSAPNIHHNIMVWQKG